MFFKKNSETIISLITLYGEASGMNSLNQFTARISYLFPAVFPDLSHIKLKENNDQVKSY